MTIKQIRYFLTAYELQNIAKAADQLFVSRPVISRALSDLESEFGFSLFLRTGNGISPTEQGREIYKLLKACSSTMEETIVRLREGYRHNADHHVKLGVLNSSGSWHYAQIITPFTQKHPDISVAVMGIQTEETMQLLEDGSVDMAIAPILMNQDPNPRIIRSQLLYDVEFVLCVPPGTRLDQQRIPTEALRKLPMAVFNNLPTPLIALDNKVLSTRKLDMIYLAVSQGFAYSILPTELTVERSDLRTIPLDPPARAHTYLLWNELLPHGKAFSLLLDYIREMDLGPLRDRFARAYHMPEPGNHPGTQDKAGEYRA
ncbi:MAG: LysR family transcriptional regulator [Oscillospiraceae bacterium]|nr:LysR family transcriptional regulator [Oscillospiraceae bacterium]MBR3554514.1 LysR family transcriptional regulator [Oscillospiraceae bacterium]